MSVLLSALSPLKRQRRSSLSFDYSATVPSGSPKRSRTSLLLTATDCCGESEEGRDGSAVDPVSYSGVTREKLLEEKLTEANTLIEDCLAKNA